MQNVLEYKKYISATNNHIDIKKIKNLDKIDKKISNLKSFERQIIEKATEILIKLLIIKSIKNFKLLHKIKDFKFFLKYEKNMVIKKKFSNIFIKFFFNFEKNIPIETILSLSIFMIMGKLKDKEIIFFKKDFIKISSMFYKEISNGSIYKIEPFFSINKNLSLKANIFKDGTLYFYNYSEKINVLKDIQKAITIYIINSKNKKKDIIIFKIIIIYPEFEERIEFEPNKILIGKNELYETLLNCVKDLEYEIKK
jgi:hypothetical protein